MAKGKVSLPTLKQISKALANSSRGPLKAKALAQALRLPKHQYAAFRQSLRDLEREGKLYRVKGNRYSLPQKINLVVGRLQVTRGGEGFVLPESGGRDLYVASTHLGSAMDGDRVVARVERSARGLGPAGRIIKVLERAHPTVVGTYHASGNYGFVNPDDRRVPRDVFIPQGDQGSAEDGDVVVVRITTYGDTKLSPVGAVADVLGQRDDPGVDILAVMHGHGLVPGFPEDVTAAGERIAAGYRGDPSDERIDRTDLHVVTIDPADARDHDDALSVVETGPGLWEVGIHIADVSFFVTPGDPLDTEALKRATSTYLVDRVVPMLPLVLSADLCSLVEGQERLCLSLFVELDDTGRLASQRVERTRIRSRHSLSYQDVERVLDGNATIDSVTDEALRTLDHLAKGIRDGRNARGSIDFDLPEAHVVLDDEGVPTDIKRVERLESHRLIEDFMVFANEVIAAALTEARAPTLYRIHEAPVPERLDRLRKFLARIGHPLKQQSVKPRDIQRLIKRTKDRPEEGLVSMVVLRSMNRARYDPVNLGHFGLASPAYLHFTSPIRRYPDLVVHRVVIDTLVRGDSRASELLRGELPGIATHVSERERVAVAAERDSIELKKVEFMERHLGDDFRGTISGVTSFGLFVLLDEFFVEGLVHVNSMNDDYYEFREDGFALVGERSHKRFRLADRVQVQVTRVDRTERRIDFMLIQEANPD